MNDFKRGLSDNFIAVLRNEAQKDGWWRDVLVDMSLLIAIRDNYLNVYWQGQSIFTIWVKQTALMASTHAKYLLNPELSQQVQFDGRDFNWGENAEGAIVRRYEGPATLQILKKAAGVYAEGEKIGVHAIAASNPAVVDVEVALSAGSHAGMGKLPRIDLAAFEQSGDGVRLVFWEAKRFGNNELRARGGNAAVVGQIAKYRLAVATHREALLRGYSRVAANLTSIADMSGGKRAVADLVRRVGAGTMKLVLRDPADVGLIIFGFDQAQRDNEPWKGHLKNLQEAIDGLRIKALGEPKNIDITKGELI